MSERQVQQHFLMNRFEGVSLFFWMVSFRPSSVKVNMMLQSIYIYMLELISANGSNKT